MAPPVAVARLKQTLDGRANISEYRGVALVVVFLGNNFIRCESWHHFAANLSTQPLVDLEKYHQIAEKTMVIISEII